VHARTRTRTLSLYHEHDDYACAFVCACACESLMWHQSYLSLGGRDAGPFPPRAYRAASGSNTSLGFNRFATAIRARLRSSACTVSIGSLEAVLCRSSPQSLMVTCTYLRTTKEHEYLGTAFASGAKFNVNKRAEWCVLCQKYERKTASTRLSHAMCQTHGNIEGTDAVWDKTTWAGWYLGVLIDLSPTHTNN
jgi:hypothetical protein